MSQVWQYLGFCSADSQANTDKKLAVLKPKHCQTLDLLSAPHTDQIRCQMHFFDGQPLFASGSRLPSHPPSLSHCRNATSSSKFHIRLSRLSSSIGSGCHFSTNFDFGDAKEGKENYLNIPGRDSMAAYMDLHTQILSGLQQISNNLSHFLVVWTCLKLNIRLFGRYIQEITQLNDGLRYISLDLSASLGGPFQRIPFTFNSMVYYECLQYSSQLKHL